jgi:hypothetical protein
MAGQSLRTFPAQLNGLQPTVADYPPEMQRGCGCIHSDTPPHTAFSELRPFMNDSPLLTFLRNCVDTRPCNE